MVSFHKLFMGYLLVLVWFRRKNEKWVKFEFRNFFLNFQKNIFYFLTFWPKFMALVDTFQRQEDFILWNFLCDNCRKKRSADFSCLFTFFKKIKIFSNFGSTEENFIINCWLWWIFNFWNFKPRATPPKFLMKIS